MLRSVLFLLVLGTFITTPSRAYEAYTTSNFMKIEEKSVADLKDYEMCRIAADNAQEKFNIKENLLHTIASVESGRWNAEVGHRVAWPWTIHANGKGKYYKSKAEAIAAVQTLQSQGVTNIDVGCMQINLKYHGKAFRSLDEAFDPKNNVSYSAQFLRKLYERNHQDWKKTAMHYHSKNYRRGINYKNRLERHFAQYVRDDNISVLFGK